MPAVHQRPIVIVDDDPDDRFFTERALAKAGVRAPVVTCGDGSELIQWLEQAATNAAAVLPRAIFLDIKMPNLSGFEVLKWIRARAELNDVRVVMLTGSEEARDTEMARRLGADDYLVKYPSPNHLLRALNGNGAVPRGKTPAEPR